MEIKAIVMAGGSGKRFWPRSQEGLPKQFLRIAGKRTLLEDTVQRLRRFLPLESIYISTRKAYADKVNTYLPEFPENNLLLEPMPKDTAAAIYLSARDINANNDTVLFFLPADHYIREDDRFVKSALHASRLAWERKHLIVMGVKPTYVSEAYGYLKLKKNETFEHAENSFTCTPVEKFLEKPSKKIAEEYVRSGHYLWNSGMFFLRKDTLKGLFEKHSPSHVKGVDQYLKYRETDFTKANRYFEAIEAISFDYAIAERESVIDCLHVDFFWDDIGSWNALKRIRPTDAHGNLFSSNVMGYQCRNVLCDIGDETLKVVLNGVKDLNIIQNKGTLYITHKDCEENIKEILKQIKSYNGG